MKKLGILFLLTLLFYQCNKEEWKTSDKEINLVKECYDNQIKDSLFIVNNIIGEWKLSAYGCDSCRPHKAPKATIMIEEGKGELIITNSQIDKEDPEEKIIEFTWILQSDRTKECYYLKTIPFDHALQMYVFSEQYMFHDSRGLDGPLYLYKKR